MITLTLTAIIIILLTASSSSGPINVDENDEQLSNRLVNTKYGVLRGTIVTFASPSVPPVSQSSLFSLPSIEAYLGVPYATPPIGSLRFMPPVTPSHWRGTKLANRLSPVCPQHIPLSSLIINNTTEALKRMPLQRFEYLRKLIPMLKNQSEDCLYLNIYTPFVATNPQTSGIFHSWFFHSF